MSVQLFHGDCLVVLKTMPDNSIDSIVTDPPYGLSKHTTDDIVNCMTAWLAGRLYEHDKNGMMGKAWDSFVPGPEVWRECLRVIKPGGHLLCFAGTRTIDLMGIAVRLAGFEIRESMAWLNSQGMPHGMDISKAIDKAAGAERKVVGTKVNTYDGSVRDPSKHGNPADQSNIGKWGLTKTPHGMPQTEPATEEAEQWQGWWSSLKPCMELIVLAQKPLDGGIVHNILRHGVGGLNIDGCRIPVDLSVDDPRLGGQGSWSTDKAAKTVYQGGYRGERVGSSPLGRYPSGVLWDGSDEVREVFDSFGEKASGVPGKRRKPHQTHSMSGTLDMLDRQEVGYADKGGVHRFFKACEYTYQDVLFALLCDYDSVILEECNVKTMVPHCCPTNVGVSEPSVQDSCATDIVQNHAQVEIKSAADFLAPFTNVTESESKQICEMLIAMIRMCECARTQKRSHGELTLTLNHVSGVAHLTPIGTMTITISHSTSGGYVTSATFSITSKSTELGEKGFGNYLRCHYASKVSPKERAGSKHVSIKPLALMRYLCRLITPKAGVILDPFAGTGTTGEAAVYEGFSAILIEREDQYVTDCRRRLALYLDE